MKLRNWHIDGSGVFSGATLPEPGLGDGFNFLMGSNEAGKSTLLDFLRYTLFGYPSGHSRLPRREPLRGGNHGGMLIYEADGLTYHLYREAVNRRAFQLRQNGTQLTDTDLAQHLGHIGPELFRNILGFSLAELQDLRSLAEGDVRGLIFAASIGQSAGRIRSLEESLSRQADAIFREGARPTAQNAPRVIKLCYELDRVEQELAQAIQASLTVPEKLRELGAKKATVETIDGRLEEVVYEIQRLDRLISGWPLWVERCHAEEERNELGDVSRFPADGDTIWAICKTEFDKARELGQARYGELSAIKEKLNQLPAEFPLLSLTGHASELAATRSDYDVAMTLAVNARSGAADAQQSWKEISEELGAGWPEDAVRDFDISLLAEDEARRLAKEVRDADLAISNKRAVSVTLAREARRLSKDCASKAKQLETITQAGPVFEPGEIAQRRASLGEFREASRIREVLRNDLGRAQDHLTQVNLFTSKREPVESYLPSWLLGALVAGAIGLAGATLVFFYTGQQLAGVMSAAFALVLVGLAVLVRSREIQGQRRQSSPPELKDAQDRCAAALKEVEDHERQWRVRATDAGVSWPVSENELTAWESRIAAEERRSADAKDLLNIYHELRDRRHAKYNEFHIAKDEFDEARRVYSNAREEWIDFLRVRRLPQTIQSETAIALFSKVKEARRSLKDFDDNSTVAKEREEEAQSYIQELARCLEQANISVADSYSKALAQFQRLGEQIDEQGKQFREEQRLVGERQVAKNTLRAAISTAKAARRKMRALTEQMGVLDERDFFDLRDRAKKYWELTHTVNQKDTALATIFGKTLPSELRETWDSGARPDWETAKFQRENEHRTLTTERDDTLRDKTALEIEIDSQLNSDEVARLQLEAEELRAEIRKGIEEWLELATALELLERTREKFERENQSPALDEASRLFRVVTGGSYERIFIPLESTEAELTILPGSGPALSLNCLSRGTLEQLFLCIRLGYVQHYQKQQNVELPLLMDDVTVNFDPERVAKTFEVLAECSRQGQQILFLTCHEHLIDLLPSDSRIFRIRNFEFESA
jgi:uncharacterized protein YhaN